MNDVECIKIKGQKPIYIHYLGNDFNNKLLKEYIPYLLDTAPKYDRKFIHQRNAISNVSSYLRYLDNKKITEVKQEDFDRFVIRSRYEVKQQSSYIKNIHDFFDFLYKKQYISNEIICNNGTIFICNIDDEFKKNHKSCGSRKKVQYSIVKNPDAISLLVSFAREWVIPQNFSYSYTSQVMMEARDFCNYFNGKDFYKFSQKDFYNYTQLILNLKRSTRLNKYIYLSYFLVYLIEYYNYVDRAEYLEIINYKLYSSNYFDDSTGVSKYIQLDYRLSYFQIIRLREYFKYISELNLSKIIIVLRMRSAVFTEVNSITNMEGLSGINNIPLRYEKNIPAYLEFVENGKYISSCYERTEVRANPHILKSKNVVEIGEQKYICYISKNVSSGIKTLVLEFCNYLANCVYYKQSTIRLYLNKICLFVEVGNIKSIEDINDDIIQSFVNYYLKYKIDGYKNALSCLDSFLSYIYEKGYCQKRYIIPGRFYVYYKKRNNNNQELKEKLNKLNSSMTDVKTPKNKYPLLNISEYFSLKDSPRINKYNRKAVLHFESLIDGNNYDLLYQWTVFQCKNGYCTFNLLQLKINKIAHFSNFVNKPWVSIEREDIVAYKTSLLKKNLKDDTINSYLRPICEFLIWALSHEKIKNLYIYNSDLIKRNYVKKNNDLSIYSLQQLFMYIDDIREDVKIMIYIMMQTGMRVSEVSHLSYNCIYSFNKNYFITYYSLKGKKENTNYISEKLYNIIIAYRTKENKSNSAYLFVSQFGKPISGDIINQEINRIIATYKLKDENGNKLKITNHCFRHTVAELLRENGASAYSIKEVLHHDSIEMTYKYVNSSDNKVMIRYNNLDDKVKAKTEISEVFIPEEYSEKDLNNKMIEILLYGSCVRHIKMGKCKSSPNGCYLCKYFKYDSNYIKQYERQLDRIQNLIISYKKNGIDYPAELDELKCKLADIVSCIQVLYKETDKEVNHDEKCF